MLPRLATLAFATLAPMTAFAHEEAPADPSTQVSEVLVNARAKASPLTGLSTSVTPTVQDTPQVVNVVPQELIRQQKITTLEQALRDVPGITVAIGEGGTLAGDQFKIRGLDAANDIYTDGLRDFGVYTRDSFDYQEVQVLKGPSGAMFGRGTTGGAINTISKQPDATRTFIDADAQVGTGRYYRGTVDMNQKVNDTTALRLNLMGTSAGVTGRDVVKSQRWGVAASAGFGLGTDTTLVVNYLHQSDDRIPDYGIIIGNPTGTTKALPATEYGLSPHVFEQFLTDRDKTRADVLTVRFRKDFGPNLSFSSDTRGGSYDRFFQYTSVDACPTNPTTGQTCIDALVDNNPATRPLITFGGSGPYRQRAWGVQNVTSVHALFDVGGLRNEVVAGTDLNYQENRKAFFAYTLPPLSSGIYFPGTKTAARNAIAIDLLTGAGYPPVGYGTFRPSVTPGVAATGIPLTSITTNAYILDSKGTAADYGAFIVDRLYFTPQVSLIAGVRYEGYEAEYANTLVSGVRQDFKADSHLTSPHVSLVYEPTADRTFYVSYAKSATPVGSGIVGTATPIAGATAAFAPDEGETYEVGAKYGLLGGRLSLSGAAFHVNKANAKQTDPVSGEVSSQSSQKQTIQGVEAGLTGQITRDWSVNVAYTYLDTQVRQDLVCAGSPLVCYANPITTGTPVLQVPENSAFVWTSYKLRQVLPGLAVAGGFTYQDGYHVRYTTTGTAPNLTLTRDAQVPSTFSLDALVQYEVKRWRVALNLYNLTDRLNYAQSFGNRAAPAQGRTAIVSVGMSF